MSTGSSSEDGATQTIAQDMSLAPEAAEEPAPASGTSLGRYLVIEELGRGGMGLVLRAYDPKLEREVAVKVLRNRDSANTTEPPEADVAWARLVREARAMARLNHPNVVGVYDVDVEPEGVLVAMEYVAGGTLSQWLDDAKRSLSEILAVFVAAGEGLAAAHERGLLHRDFKPSNVLIGRDGSIKVTDFGLARELSDESGVQPPQSSKDSSAPFPSEESERWGSSSSALSQELTQAGIVLGTPNYMPPEQLQGAALDPRADQYAYCVALWRALTGTWPFSSHRHKRRGAPPWPRDVPVPRAVAEAIRRGLRPKPEDRWPTLPTLLTELKRDRSKIRRRVLAGAGAAALAIGVWGWQAGQRAHQFSLCVQEGDTIAELWNADRSASAATAFEVSGVPYAAATWSRTAKGLDEYAEGWRRVRTEVCEKAHVEESLPPSVAAAATACLDEHREKLAALVERLVAPDEATVNKAASATASLPLVSLCTDETQLRHRVDLPETPEARAQMARMHRELARAWTAHATGRYEEALDTSQSVLDEAASLGWTPVSAEAGLAVGSAQDALGRVADSERSYRRAFLEAGATGQDMTAHRAASALTYVVGAALVRHDEGFHWAQIAQMLQQRLGLEQEHIEVARALHNLGAVYQSQRKPAEALANHQDALAIREKLLGSDHLDVANSLHNIGVAQRAIGQYADALASQRRALEIKERFLGAYHPSIAASHINIGHVHISHGKHTEALAAFEDALKILQSSLGAEHPSVAEALGSIGDTHRLLGDLDRAREFYLRAMAIWERTLGPEHPVVAKALQNLGNLYAGDGDYVEAIAIFERALAIREKANVATRELAQSRFALGQALWDGGGDKKRAYALAKAGRDAYREAGPDTEMIAAVTQAWLEGHPEPE